MTHGDESDAPRPWYLPRLDGLAVRVAAFLSLALLPVGMIAVYQANEFRRESEESASLTLLALTGQSAVGVQQAIHQALGAAESLGMVSDLLDDPESCAGYLRRYVEPPSPYTFIGLLPGEGPVTCSSEPEPFEIEDRADWATLIADPRPRVRANPQGRVSGQDVIIVLSPLGRDAAGASAGYLGISIPRDGLVVGAPSATQPLRLVTFNADGMVLTSDAGGGGGEDLAALLPEGRDLAAEAQGGARTFEARDAEGRERLYTVAPLVPDVAYAMGIWTPVRAAPGLDVGGPSRAPVLLLPFLMWGASLIVAFWSIHRLVLGRVADLGERMRRFGRDRTLPEPLPARSAAFELREIDRAFRQTAEEILQDEARMEDGYRERGVLLREVHHRVKNNLQLISSIISMQARRTPDPRTRAILRRLQDRVLTLATIYRSLYTSADMASVNAADVLRAIVEQEVEGVAGDEGRGAAEVRLDFDDVVLDPDKVVPLAFLAAEASSNALAHASASAGASGGQPALVVSLRRDGDLATLAVVNATGGQATAPDGGQGVAAQGLGQHLIRAFAAQVGGPATVSTEGGTYRLSITFPVDEDPVDRAA